MITTVFRFVGLSAIALLGLGGPDPAEAGRLGVCYECKADGVPTPYYRWGGKGPLPRQCGALSGSKKRAPAHLCDAAEGIVRWSGTNDPFWKCQTGTSDHTAWLGGENKDLVVLGLDASNINAGAFFRIQDGREYRCGIDFASGRNFSALRYGRKRDLLDIFTHDSKRTFTRTTYRIQDGAQHHVVFGDNYVARLYGRNKDILALYGITSKGEIVVKAHFVNDGRHHILEKLNGTDVGLTYGRKKDIRVRYCFDGQVWHTGYIGIGHGFRDRCTSKLNW